MPPARRLRLLPAMAAALATAWLAGCESRSAPARPRPPQAIAAGVRAAVAGRRDGSVQRVRRAGYLRVGMDDTSGPPFIFWQGAKGQERIQGFEVQIAQRIARGLGVNLRIVVTPWQGLRAGLADDRYDLIVNGQEVPEDPARRPDLFFSRPYYQSSQTVVVSVAETRVWRLGDLAGRPVGVLEAGVGGAILTELNDQRGMEVTVRRFREVGALLAAVAHGEVAGALVDAPLASWHLRGRPGLKVVGHPVLPRPYAVVGRAGDQQLAAAVEAVLGQTEKIRPLLQHWSLWNHVQPGFPAPENSQRAG